jgi:hypothetical protein
VTPSPRRKLPRVSPDAPTLGGTRALPLVAAREVERPSYVSVMRLLSVALLASPIALAAACGPSTPEAHPPGGMQPVNVPPTPSSSGSLEPTGPVPLGGAPMPVSPSAQPCPPASGAPTSAMLLAPRTRG